MNLTLCIGCGTTIHDGQLPERFELGACCKPALGCESEAVLHAENIRESLTKPGAHAEY